MSSWVERKAGQAYEDLDDNIRRDKKNERDRARRAQRKGLVPLFQIRADAIEDSLIMRALQNEPKGFPRPSEYMAVAEAAAARRELRARTRRVPGYCLGRYE
jgi:hypothetical protein